MAAISKKICMVGDFGVGKTSLIRRFVEGEFSDRYLSTVGVKISRKPVELPDLEKQLQLIIWDLEGHTKFKAIAPSYLQGAKGALIVADLTRPETVDRIGEHLKLFFSVNPAGKTIVALNKSDLVESAEGEKLRDRVKQNHDTAILDAVFTSAKTGQNVDPIFESLSRTIV